MWKKLKKWLRAKKPSVSEQNIADLLSGRVSAVDVVKSFKLGRIPAETLLELRSRQLLSKKALLEAAPEINCSTREITRDPAIRKWLEEHVANPANPASLQPEAESFWIPNALLLHGLANDYLEVRKDDDGEWITEFNVERWLKNMEESPANQPAHELN